MFKALSGGAELFGTASMDSSHVKAHRSVAGKSDIPASARIRKRAYKDTAPNILVPLAGHS